MGMLANPFDRGKLRHDGGETGEGQQHPRMELDLDAGVVRIETNEPEPSTEHPDRDNR